MLLGCRPISWNFVIWQVMASLSRQIIVLYCYRDLFYQYWGNSRAWRVTNRPYLLGSLVILMLESHLLLTPYALKMYSLLLFVWFFFNDLIFVHILLCWSFGQGLQLNPPYPQFCKMNYPVIYVFSFFEDSNFILKLCIWRFARWHQSQERPRFGSISPWPKEFS